MHKLGYVRISREESQDPASQIKLMQDLGIAMEDIFIDSVSGGVAPNKRPQYNKLLSRIALGGITEIVFSEYSRVGRDIVESLSEVLNLMKLGIRIQSLSQSEKHINNYQIADQLVMITIAMGSAQRERDHIKERTKWGMENAKEKGTRSGKPIGRPVVTIDFAAVQKLMQEKDLKEAQAIRVLGIKPRTYYKKKPKIVCGNVTTVNP